MDSSPKGKHLAGILPIAGWGSSLGFLWGDHLHPIGDHCTALERALHELVIAGCDSIWIVCNDDTEPLVKTLAGDYVLNSDTFPGASFRKYHDLHKRYTPIFYIPVAQKDRGRRDSLGWSILSGALTAFKVSASISKWVVPTKYYVSFPYGIYDPEQLRDSRTVIRSSDSFYVSYNGKTVRDNLFLGFSFCPLKWKQYKKNVKRSCSGGDPSLPLHERWSSKDFSLDKIFYSDTIEEKENIFSIKEYHSLTSWADVQRFYSSGLVIKKPPENIIKPFFK